mmetsp:Transcript_39375/g.82450  ORF Transcript_39375/g.82450 Transcript_39375/m.82450 type:complete len:189 (-) Transcript_39375:371-937(-)
MLQILRKLVCNKGKGLVQARSLYDAPLEMVFDPNMQDYKIPDYGFKRLQSISNFHFGVEYLSVSKKPPSFPVEGLILGNNRMLINLCCSVAHFGSESDPRSWMNVLFILNTGSPTTFLSTQAIEKLGGYQDGPTRLRIHTDRVQEAYPAPRRSQFTELNILGMDFLQDQKVRTIIEPKNCTFILDASV